MILVTEKESYFKGEVIINLKFVACHHRLCEVLYNGHKEKRNFFFITTVLST